MPLGEEQALRRHAAARQQALQEHTWKPLDTKEASSTKRRYERSGSYLQVANWNCGGAMPNVTSSTPTDST